MLSIVIPAYTIDEETEEVTMQAVLSYKEYCDELIITEDGGNYSEKLRNEATAYIYNRENKGFSVNVNRGFRYAVGDYIAIVSSDTRLYEGNPRDLCIPGTVTSPHIVNQSIERLAGPFFVVPKEVRNKRGYLLEEMRTYCSDSEYDHRVKDIFQKVPSVKIYHHMAHTVKKAGVEGGIEQRRDNDIYFELVKQGRAAA